MELIRTGCPPSDEIPGVGKGLRYNSRDTTVDDIDQRLSHQRNTSAGLSIISVSGWRLSPPTSNPRARRHPPRNRYVFTQQVRNTGSLRPSATPLSVRYTVGLLCPRLPALRIVRYLQEAGPLRVGLRVT